MCVSCQTHGHTRKIQRNPVDPIDRSRNPLRNLDGIVDVGGCPTAGIRLSETLLIERKRIFMIIHRLAMDIEEISTQLVVENSDENRRISNGNQFGTQPLFDGIRIQP